MKKEVWEGRGERFTFAPDPLPKLVGVFGFEGGGGVVVDVDVEAAAFPVGYGVVEAGVGLAEDVGLGVGEGFAVGIFVAGWRLMDMLILWVVWRAG